MKTPFKRTLLVGVMQLLAGSLFAQKEVGLEVARLQTIKGCQYAVATLNNGHAVVIQTSAALLAGLEQGSGSVRVDAYVVFNPKKELEQTATFRTTLDPAGKPAKMKVVAEYASYNMAVYSKFSDMCKSAKLPSPTTAKTAAVPNGPVAGAVAAKPLGKLDARFYGMTKAEEELFAKYPFVTGSGILVGPAVIPLLKGDGFAALLPLNATLPEDEAVRAAVYTFATEWERATSVPAVAASVGVRLLLKKAAQVNQKSSAQELIMLPTLNNKMLDAALSVASPWVDAEILYYGMRGTGPTKGIDPVAEVSRVVQVRSKAGGNYKAALISCFNQIRDKQETNAEEKLKPLRTWLYDQFIDQTPLKWMNQLTSAGKPEDEAKLYPKAQ